MITHVFQILPLLIVLSLTSLVYSDALQASPPLETRLRQGLTLLEEGDHAAGYRAVVPLALKGDPRAQYVVGLLFERGLHLAKNLDAARRWYVLAAEQGHAGAQNNLGLLLKNSGQRGALVESYAWLARSTVAGNAKARENRGLVAAMLSEEQLEEAQRKAADWWPKSWVELQAELEPDALPPLPGQPFAMETETTETETPQTSPQSQTPQQQDDADTPPAGPLSGLLAWSPGSADPLHEGGSLVLAMNCYSRLVEAIPKPGAPASDKFSSSLAPGLAERWLAEENERGEAVAYTFTLKEGARFHNGAPVTVDDVVFSLTRLLDPPPSRQGGAPESGNEAAGLMLFIQGAREYSEGLAERVSGLQAVDERTLRIVLHTPYAGFPAVLAHPRASILCRSFTEQLGADYGNSPETTCGSGPYRLVSWERGEELVLQRLAADAANMRAPSEVTLRIEPDPEEALEAFEDGDIDYLDGGDYPSLNHHIAEMAREEQGWTLTAGPCATVYFLAVNNAEPPFDSLLARKALQLAMDRRAMLEQAAPGAALVQGVLPPGVHCQAPLPGRLRQNVDVAREFLAQSGHGDGVQLRLATIEGRGEPFATLERLVAESVAQAGIEVEFVPHSLAEYQARLARGELSSYVGEWSSPIDDPDAFFHPFFSGRGTVARSIRYANGAMRTRVERAATLADQTRRCEMYQALGRIISQQDAAWLPLYAPGRSLLLASRVATVRLPWDGCSVLRFSGLRMR